MRNNREIDMGRGDKERGDGVNGVKKIIRTIDT
jgi:hypothetical protein